ncbi:hypothetical protein ACFPC0_10705 [Streptomyces andamanensis]|uniref:Uncharacterized protein n=1 Tax=Streptomyces andamanensis TaxID=1565035 RepID=A0ABV8TCL6_9ACTN
MNKTKPAAELEAASTALIQQLALADGQPCLPDMYAATEVMSALTHVADQMQMAIALTGEFVRQQGERGLLEMAPETEGDPTHTQGLTLLGCRSALLALDAACRSLSGTHQQMQNLATTGSDATARPPAASLESRAKGHAMNLLTCALSGEYGIVHTMAHRMSEQEARDLIVTLRTTMDYVARPHHLQVPA